MINQSKGKFVLVLGDDDIFVNKSLFKIIYFLKRFPNAGLVSLGTKGLKEIDNSHFEKFVSDDIRYVHFEQKKQFIEFVNVNLSFTSSIIFNFGLIEKRFLDRFKGSNLPNIAIILKLISQNYKNYSILNTYILGQHGNNSGYNSFKIFNKELFDLTSLFSNHQFEFSKIFSKCFVRYLHPYDFYHYMQKHNGIDSDLVWLDYKYLSGYLEYWIFLVPINYLPNIFRVWVFNFYRVYVKLLLVHSYLLLKLSSKIKIISIEE